MSVKNAMIRARVESGLKDKAEAVFSKLGLNPTDAITIFYSQVALKKTIPFTLDLERNDTPNNYVSVKSDTALRTLLDLE